MTYNVYKIHFPVITHTKSVLSVKNWKACSFIVTPVRKRAGYQVGVRIYIHVCAKKIVIEQTRDLIYLKYVVTDFFQKIISPSAGETPVTQRSPCYSAVSALLTNPLPDRSNYSPLLLHLPPHSPDQ